MPITVIVELQLRSESVDEVLARFKVDLADTRAFAGCISVSVVRSQENPDLITLVERWQERRDEEKYLAWRQATGSMKKTAEALAHPLKITYYNELPEV